MSEKEQLLQLIDNMPDYKIGYILAFSLLISLKALHMDYKLQYNAIN